MSIGLLDDCHTSTIGFPKYLPWRLVPVGAVENVPRQHSGEQHARGRDGRQLSLTEAQTYHHCNATFVQVSVMGFAYRSLEGVFSYSHIIDTKKRGAERRGGGEYRCTARVKYIRDIRYIIVLPTAVPYVAPAGERLLCHACDGGAQRYTRTRQPIYFFSS